VEEKMTKDTVALASVVSLSMLTHAVPAWSQRPGRTFESPAKTFSIVVPDLPFGTRVEKRTSKEEGTVAFLGGFGHAQRIDYMRVPAETPPPGEPEQQEAYARVIKGLSESKGGAVVSDRPYPLDGMSMRLAVVSLPGGSHLADPNTKKHLDSVVGLLVFVRSGFLYVLHYELVPPAGNVGSEPLPAEELNRRAELFLPQMFHAISFAGSSVK
jgi:hypothetical protein